MGEDFTRKLRRRGFFGIAGAVALLTAARPAIANPWPRDEEDNECDKPTKDHDVDAPWHHKDADEDGNAGCKSGTALTIDQTRNLGLAFAQALLTDPSLRKEYYHLIRSFKKKYWDPANNQHGGKYGVAYLKILNQLNPPVPLKLDDIANIHLTAFLEYRRAVLALTGHDIDPDASSSRRTHEFTFHWGPNVGSTVSPWSGADLVDPANP